jgi:DNA-binding PadR family transcriptional regulator
MAADEALGQPVTEASFLILLALAERPMHGYLIMQTINAVFRAGFKMGPGTLYRTLQLQMRDGLIRELESDGHATEDARRRLYAITSRGRAVARREMERLRTLHGLARARMGQAQADA